MRRENKLLRSNTVNYSVIPSQPKMESTLIQVNEVMNDEGEMKSPTKTTEEQREKLRK